ncbi:MAG: HAMP domain-containing histidine kinase [Oscillospiraceae bacterium]|nr:HAMP domain-containing histidine kinase [Oscillospiraceae bacterium]
MKTRELFEEIRQKEIRFSLKNRLTLLVTLEIIVCVLLALAVDTLLKRWLPDFWNIPLLLDLVFFSSLIGVFVTQFLSRMFFDPIKKLREAIGKVADGDYSVEINTKSNSKEIQEIYSGFNLMTHELRSTEILQLDFVSSASHEFKTPISAIEGYAALLRSGGDLTEEQRECVEKIIFNTKRLSSLTSSILLLSKLENQEIPTNQSKFLVDEQIRQSVVALETQWERKNIELDVDLCEAEYYGNEVLMRHVWDNLIGNAIKFTPEGSTVTIRLAKKLTKIIFTVEDQGPGIPEEALRHVFDKFYQADSVHKKEGSGLGLALVEKVLALEKGSVKAENMENGGCRFTVTLRTIK